MSGLVRPSESRVTGAVEKRVGGSLTALPLFQRLEMFRRNAKFFKKGKLETIYR
jgi:hypothetical protein